MFVLLHPKGRPTVCDETFQLSERFQLPRSCNTFVLNLLNCSEGIKANCCQNLVVYDDMCDDYNNLKVADDKIDPMEFNEMVEINSLNDISDATWYQSNKFARGFNKDSGKIKGFWD